MSRAFTKEPDGDSTIDDLPEIPISPHPNIVTASGFQKIENRISELQAELQSAKGKDRSMEARVSRDLRYWNARRASAETAPTQADTEEVRFGHSVTIMRNGQQETFRIVGQDEADPSQGLLSYVSPLARALIGRGVGDHISSDPHDIEIINIAN